MNADSPPKASRLIIPNDLGYSYGHEHLYYPERLRRLIDCDSIQAYSDSAKVLLVHIQAQDPIRNALRESEVKG
jgi:hypothetical protein